MRILFAFCLVCAVEFVTLPAVVAQKSDNASLNELKSLAGVLLQEKEGELIGADFRNRCKLGWCFSEDT